METDNPKQLCNLCGLSCHLADIEGITDYGGIIGLTVAGGYFSTPGNGDGALDDNYYYKFSLCEFCLDWLFTQFKIPVSVNNDYDNSKIEFKSAAQRVLEDDWRTEKEKFYQEYLRRATARTKESSVVERFNKLKILK